MSVDVRTVLSEDELEAGRIAEEEWQRAQPDEDDRLLAAIDTYQRSIE